MRRTVHFLVNGAVAVVLLGSGSASQAQNVPAASPVASPVSVTDPKDPPASPALSKTEKSIVGDSSDVPNTQPETRLQSEVQEALGRVPELSNDTLEVAASADGLELTGTVVTGRERQAAVRIAQSYARGRKVVDHIVVSGRNTPPAEGTKAAHQANAQP